MADTRRVVSGRLVVGYNMYYFYVLRSSKDDRLYKGFTKDLERRLGDHNSGKVMATRHRKPFKIIYSESFNNKNDAIIREKYFKSFKGGKELKKIIDRI